MTKKNKVYAVKKGNITGIFNSWEECQNATKGFSGAVFKSFETEEAAQAFLNDEDIVLENDIMPHLSNGTVVAFVDGSFNSKRKIYGYGVYIFAPNLDEPLELCGKGSNEKYINLQNTAGELLGAINAIDWAWKNGFNKIAIIYDYEGLAKWANGEWKANQPLSQFYYRYIQEKRDFINIEFVKVRGHSNNKYNDRADLLAKSSINENRVLKDSRGNSGYIIGNVKEKQIKAVIEKLSLECEGFSFTVTTDGNKKIYSLYLNNEKITLSLFNDIKLMVQGKKNNLFQLITTEIIESIECGDFIQILRNAYEINIDASKISLEYKKELPLLQSTALPLSIQKLLQQAIIDLNNPGYGDIEFSKYTLAVLRALEGILKLNLSKCNIHMNGTRFNMFDKADGVYKLQAGFANNLDAHSVEKIENCYNQYYNQRHTLCHFGVIINNVDTNTRLINSKSEADSIIKETLQVINDNLIL